jgi:hypothetical protein
MTEKKMTMEELYALPVSFDLETAGRAWGFGRTKSHQLARTGDFPCRVLRYSKRYVVTKADLFGGLGMTLEVPADSEAACPECGVSKSPALKISRAYLGESA